MTKGVGQISDLYGRESFPSLFPVFGRATLIAPVNDTWGELSRETFDETCRAH